MNKENLKTLIATIKAAGKRGDFDIHKYAHDCGSPSCIAGYAAHLQGLEIKKFKWREDLPATVNVQARWYYSREYKKALAKYLGVSPSEAHEIAVGYDVASLSEVTVEVVIEFLEAMLEQGRPLTWAGFFCGAER